MQTTTRHDRALDAATEEIRSVRPDDLTRDTPCAGWTLSDLVAHMVGQNHGFADALRGGTDPAAYAPRPPDGWPGSVVDLRDAIARPATDAVLLPEIATARTFPVDVVLGMHLLDTVVHTWDVATALGRTWRPEDELVSAVLEQARLVPAGERRTRPGAAFAPAVPTTRQDPWSETLALLGRSPGS